MTSPSEQPKSSVRGKRGLPRSVRKFIRRRKAALRRRYPTVVERERALQELLARFGLNE